MVLNLLCEISHLAEIIHGLSGIISTMNPYRVLDNSKTNSGQPSSSQSITLYGLRDVFRRHCICLVQHHCEMTRDTPAHPKRIGFIFVLFKKN